MTGLEPHPILRLPTAEACRRVGVEETQRLFAERARRMIREKQDPLNFGFEPEIWHIVDDLLVDGKKVVLDLSRLERIGAAGGVDVPKEIEGRAEIYIAGSNRSSKSEYGAKKIMKILVERPNARTWSFADTGPISAARQQPIFAKYLPVSVKRAIDQTGTGKVKKGGILNVSYTQKGGFTEQTFVLENGSQHWFKNYEQHLTNVEGDQLDAIWLDELRNIELLRTLRGRVIDRAGLIIVTFTAIDDNYSAIVNEYERGARTLLEVDAELLPIKRPKNLSVVPVLAEPTQLSRVATPDAVKAVGEAREKHNTVDPRIVDGLPDSRGGGQTDLSGARMEPHHRSALDRRGDVVPSNVQQGGASAQIDFKKLSSRLPPLKTPPDGDQTRRFKADDAGGSAAHRAAGASSSEDFEIVGYEKVPRIKIAGPGTDGNQRANIVYFHITDNPYFGYDGAMNRRRDGRVPLFGKDRYYKAYRNATRAKILSRVYGILTGQSAQQFPKFRDVIHVVPPNRVPREGSNYHLVDPCSGRNWFMHWVRIDPRGRWFIYREWPSHGHAGAYIPGIGDPGPWTLPGQPADGVRGPAQSPFGFGLERYRQEILRVEGHPEARAGAPAAEEKPAQDRPWWRSVAAPRNPVAGITETGAPIVSETGFEKILERWMDSRYGSSPTTTKEGTSTLIEQMGELDMDFLAASGKEIDEGTTLVNDLLDYDEEVPIGEFSPRLARINEPRLFISENCPNTIYALREYTGKDRQHGACKDPIDLLRYASLAGLEYVGADAYTWVGGGTY